MDGEIAFVHEASEVLVVDDHRPNLELVEAILVEAGYRVRLAHDGQQALDAVQAASPDCIVLDVMMPRLDGFEVCRRLKADRATRAIPVVLLTALSDVEDKVTGLEMGADDFLTKPVDAQALLARVRSLIRIKRLYDELETSENIIYSMAQALESKHPLLHGHAERVATTALLTARALGLPGADQETVGKAAFLHDLGKLGVADDLIALDRPLERGELAQYHRHPEIGDAILSPLRSFAPVRRILRHHHERLNGSGFPDGLGGDELDLLTEIVAVANAVEDAASRGGRDEAAALLRGAVARGEFRRDTVATVLAQPPPGTTPGTRRWDALLPAQLPRRPGKIAVADDTQLNRDLLAEVLSSDGHKVISVPSGAALLKVIADEQPDLVVADVRMPDINGFELCRRLKRAPDTLFLPVVLITAHPDAQDRKRGVEAGCDDFLFAPINRLELEARVHSLLRMRFHYRDLEALQRVLLTLASVIEAKHPYTRGHSERVGELATRLGREVGLPDAELAIMRMAGLLHDIGKVGVPDRLLNKPGKLTSAEFQTIMTHPVLGESICRPLRTVRAALPLIRHHHERHDGRGYPDHLKGEQIPVGARVLAMADAWDALTSERSYRRTLTNAEALDILEREAIEGLWDPTIFNALKLVIRRGLPPR
jgi:putative two-component system response regulator